MKPLANRLVLGGVNSPRTSLGCRPPSIRGLGRAPIYALRFTQSERVADHDHRGAGHGRRCQARDDHTEDGQRDGDHVVTERPHQILLDDPEGSGRDPQRRADRAHVGIHDRHIRGGFGHVGPRSHGDRQIGSGQGGGVVHTVSHHRDRPAFGVEAFDDGELALGQDARPNVVDACLCGDGTCRRLIVAGHENRPQA